mmetsp:Transcript_10295/g.23221  ORF Transcript_10295/g.23221 Transcript_10295/m.23221 type:complete len:221 (-) Transcript_10295:220-882(-)
MRFEREVATTSTAASRDTQSVADLGQLADKVPSAHVFVTHELLQASTLAPLLGLHPAVSHPDNGARRHTYVPVPPVSAIELLALAHIPIRTVVVHGLLQWRKGCLACNALEVHVPTVSPIAAIRPSEGHILLTPEGLAPVATIAALHIDHRNVEVTPIRVIPLGQSLLVLPADFQEATLGPLLKAQLEVFVWQCRQAIRDVLKYKTTCIVRLGPCCNGNS